MFLFLYRLTAIIFEAVCILYQLFLGAGPWGVRGPTRASAQTVTAASCCFAVVKGSQSGDILEGTSSWIHGISKQIFFSFFFFFWTQTHFNACRKYNRF